MGETTKDHLFVEELGGQGKTVILVHCLGGTTNTWYPQAQVLKRDLCFIAYDLAGSDRSPVRDGISIVSHVADLLEIARRFAAQGQVHTAGHSLDAIICQHAVSAHPDLVASLTLAGPFPEPPEAARAALRERAARARAEKMRGVTDAIVAGGMSDDTKVNQPAVAAPVRESLMAASRGLRPQPRGVGRDQQHGPRAHRVPDSASSPGRRCAPRPRMAARHGWANPARRWAASRRAT